AAIERVNRQIARKLETAAHPFLKQAVELIQEIPGIGERVAQTIISEIGIEMDRFPSPAHLASWAGMCPGNHESAGRRQRGQTTKGSIYLRVALVQAAWAATHTKETYLAAQYQKLIKRLGRKKALVAVGHSILLIVYQMLKNRVNYCDLGADYFDRLSVERQRRNLIRRLEALGCRVSIELKDAPV
ncbi:MAG TPA: transposase, partial [Blastocatellia bacterium]|nr:transposase [Blastocatellia bacterium]